MTPIAGDDTSVDKCAWLTAQLAEAQRANAEMRGLIAEARSHIHNLPCSASASKATAILFDALEPSPLGGVCAETAKIAANYLADIHIECRELNAEDECAGCGFVARMQREIGATS